MAHIRGPFFFEISVWTTSGDDVLDWRTAIGWEGDLSDKKEIEMSGASDFEITSYALFVRTTGVQKRVYVLIALQ